MKKQYDIVGNRKKFFIFSAVLIVFILLFSVIFGVEMDIQFKGGAMLTSAIRVSWISLRCKRILKVRWVAT